MQGVAPQNRHVTSVAQEFLSVHWDRRKPLLLGYSGGPDSKALLYALLECNVTPHLVHVDHGWREESRKETLELQEEARKLGCPFFSTRLENARKEDEAREGRYAFFVTFFPKYASLLLAHTLEDLAETVLKRILEGAHLCNLGGMQPVSKQNGMAIWRPFLRVKKRDLFEFLQERGLPALNDPTNADPAFLRARMRKEIFPLINQWFGKEIYQNLALLSERSYELKKYLDSRISSVPEYKGPWGAIFELKGLGLLEIRHFLLKLAKAHSIVFTRPVLNTLIHWVLSQETSKHLVVKNKKIYIDNQRTWVCTAI